MDLSTLAIIVIVFFVSLFSILFISRFPKGKSFEEMLKEKRELREKIMGTTGNVSGNKEKKDSSNKKTKKMNNKKPNKSQKVVLKDSDQDSVEVESDANSSDSQQFEEEINPLTYAKKIEYVETEAFQLTDPHHAKKNQQKIAQGGKKNKNKGGILVNKAEPVLVKQESATEVNHFEIIHPKDDIEIARAHQKDDDNKEKKSKEQKKNKKSESKTTPPISPKNSVKEVEEAPIVAVENKQVAVPPTKSVAVQNKEKSNKKKKNELITQLTAEVHDDVNVHSLVRILGKADLPRNEIQILIDFLLNKQQDTLTKDPSEWNDPSDPLQKLKKQFQDKENQLREEQGATSALHAKLKELRSELNNERSHGNAAVRACTEELNQKKMELQNVAQQLQIVSEKAANESQTLTSKYNQLQTQFIQYTKEQQASQEQAQQLNEKVQLLQQELGNKNQIMNEKYTVEEELLQKRAELEKACADMKIMLHQKDEIIRQRSQDIAKYENDIKVLTADLDHKEEFVETCTAQKYEIEQLKQQMADQQSKNKQALATASAAAAANNHLDENSKVEIRNLQNALDSSKTELTACRTEVNDYKAKIAECDKQINDLKLKEEELYKQIEEQKTKNNEKTQAEQSANHIKEVNAVNKIIFEEQTRTKELLLKLLPTDITSVVQNESKENDFYQWLESTISCIKEQQENIKINNSNDHHVNNSTNDSHHLNDKANHGHAGEEEAKEDDSEKKMLLLHNAQLQKTVDEYKIIIADTESILKNLETKVREPEILIKSSEIQS